MTQFAFEPQVKLSHVTSWHLPFLHDSVVPQSKFWLHVQLLFVHVWPFAQWVSSVHPTEKFRYDSKYCLMGVFSCKTYSIHHLQLLQYGILNHIDKSRHASQWRTEHLIHRTADHNLHFHIAQSCRILYLHNLNLEYSSLSISCNGKSVHWCSEILQCIQHILPLELYWGRIQSHIDKLQHDLLLHIWHLHRIV